MYRRQSSARSHPAREGRDPTAVSGYNLEHLGAVASAYEASCVKMEWCYAQYLFTLSSSNQVRSPHTVEELAPTKRNQQGNPKEPGQ